MATMFDEGAAFIEKACAMHLRMKARTEYAEAHGLPPPKAQPVSIFVHCVAGVHRSAMVVVWWMCKYHGWNLRDAWSTVRETRDAACKWSNVTLGGSPETGRKSNWFTGCWNVLVRDGQQHQQPLQQEESGPVVVAEGGGAHIGAKAAEPVRGGA